MPCIGLIGFNNLEKFGLSFLIQKNFPAFKIIYTDFTDACLDFDCAILNSASHDLWLAQDTHDLFTLVFSERFDSIHEFRNLTVINNFNDHSKIDIEICQWLKNTFTRIQQEEELEHSSREQKFLSKREHQVMKLLTSGSSNENIAFIPGIGLTTVKTHLFRIYGKLGASNRVHAVSIYREWFGQQ